MRIASIIGARPQLIKAAVVSRALADYGSRVEEVLIHTGQHYDYAMSGIFFDELGIPTPVRNLEIGGGSHGQNTGRMIEQIERVLVELKPDWCLVYGDTDSTLAGVVAASKLQLPIGHVEAGLRSYNRNMPEEINRVIADELSAALFCPTEAAVLNLEREGYPRHWAPGVAQQILNVGDVMYDVALHFADLASAKSTILAAHGLRSGGYVLATVHRAEKTDQVACLESLIEAMRRVALQVPVVWPMHPRTAARIKEHGLSVPPSLTVIPPLGFLDMMVLEKNAAVVATDSGGMQKEAFFHGVPCVTLRRETEWTELVDLGWNRLAPPMHADIAARILEAVGTKGRPGSPYGRGQAARLIAQHLMAGAHRQEDPSPPSLRSGGVENA
jgi:UDP-GlcNAc3NAcA epimerase